MPERWRPVIMTVLLTQLLWASNAECQRYQSALVRFPKANHLEDPWMETMRPPTAEPTSPRTRTSVSFQLGESTRGADSPSVATPWSASYSTGATRKQHVLWGAAVAAAAALGGIVWYTSAKPAEVWTPIATIPLVAAGAAVGALAGWVVHQAR
jgi:hypothetical protein